jgi:hypothetical protein
LVVDILIDGFREEEHGLVGVHAVIASSIEEGFPVVE